MFLLLTRFIWWPVMQQYNQLSLEVYQGNDTAPVQAWDRIEGLEFDTQYPGGIFGGMRATILGQDTLYNLMGNERFVVRNFQKQVYEGFLDELIPGNREVSLVCVGPWGRYMGGLSSSKIWADDRVSSQAWWPAAEGGTCKPDLFTVDNYNRIGIIPKAQAVVSGDHMFQYYFAIAPGGTIKRFTYNYDFDEDSQAWEGTVASSDDLSSWTTLATYSATASGSADLTLATPQRYLRVCLMSKASQTPPSNGDVRFTISSPRVYQALSSADTAGAAMNLDVLLRDLAAILAGTISADTSRVSSNTYSLIPFYSNPAPEALASTILRAAAFGDSSYNPWAVYLGPSSWYSDNLPGFVSQAIPSLSAWDVGIFKRALNAPLRQVYGEIANTVTVTYVDAEGRSWVLNASSNPELTDALSVKKHGRRDHPIRLPGNVTATQAANIGARYLAAHKNPRWFTSGARVGGGAIGPNGEVIPASEIRAGMRLAVLDFISRDTGMPFVGLIQKTKYSHDTQTCDISLSEVDPLLPILTRLIEGV